MLYLAVKFSEFISISPCFMTLILLQSAGQVFSRMSPHLGLFGIFLGFDCGFGLGGKDITATMSPLSASYWGYLSSM